MATFANIAAARLALTALSGKEAKQAQQSLAADAVAYLCEQIVMHGNTTAAMAFEHESISRQVKALALAQRDAAILERAALKTSGRLAKNGQVAAEHAEAAMQFAAQCGANFAAAREEFAAAAADKRKATADNKAEAARLAKIAADAQVAAAERAVKHATPVADLTVYSVASLILGMQTGDAEALAACEAIAEALAAVKATGFKAPEQPKLGQAIEAALPKPQGKAPAKKAKPQAPANSVIAQAMEKAAAEKLAA